MILESIWVVLAVFFGIIALVLLVKTILMKKSAREIRGKMPEIMNTDTNTQATRISARSQPTLTSSLRLFGASGCAVLRATRS